LAHIRTIESGQATHAETAQTPFAHPKPKNASAWDGNLPRFFSTAWSRDVGPTVHQPGPTANE